MQHLLRPLDSMQLSPSMWYQPMPSMHYYMPPLPPSQTYTASDYLPQQPCAPSHLQLRQPPQAAFTFSLPRSTFPRYPSTVPDKLSVPELEPSSTPSEPGSPNSTLAPPTPIPPVAHVVCNVPLRAPKPLPYRPPAFLNSFKLPDPDADLSRPPYTCAAGSKRKRSDEALQGEATDTDDRSSSYTAKRRATEHAVRGRPPTASLNDVFSTRRFSCLNMPQSHYSAPLGAPNSIRSIPMQHSRTLDAQS